MRISKQIYVGRLCGKSYNYFFNSCCSIICWYFSGKAPTSTIGFPPTGIKNSVGSAWILKTEVNSRSSSLFTLQNITWSLYFSAIKAILATTHLGLSFLWPLKCPGSAAIELLSLAQALPGRFSPGLLAKASSASIFAYFLGPFKWLRQPSNIINPHPWQARLEHVGN